MRSISLQVQRPAQIGIDPTIKKIVLLNRTKPDAGSKLEGVLSGEGFGQDKPNIEECMNGALGILSNTTRFQAARASEYFTNERTMGKNFAQPINWNDIALLCSKYQTDAVLALEFFDTDFIVTNGNKTTPAEANKPAQTTYWAKGVLNVFAGFRLYDPLNKNIIFQDRFAFSRNWESSASSVAEAIAKLIQKDQAVKNISAEVGKSFAGKITPLFVWENRTFFKGKDALMKKGERYGRVFDWENAGKAWLEVTKSGNQKEKGRACFNLALVHEVYGELEKAKEWATRAYTEYGERKAQNYAQLLDQRIADAERLKKQMNEQ